VQKYDPSSLTDLRHRIVELRRLRQQMKDANRRPRQHRLNASERAQVLEKTGGRCHICGGDITGYWHADHVLAHSAGGQHTVDNYLPAHKTCNNYRWDYLPQEFGLILKLGVWVRTQIEKGTPIGANIEQKFTAYEAKRIGRCKSRKR